MVDEQNLIMMDAQNKAVRGLLTMCYFSSLPPARRFVLYIHHKPKSLK
jgi:hypothetical protein